MKTRINYALALVWGAAIIVVSLAPSMAFRPLAAAEKAALYGGADCWTKGTGNCPAAGSCTLTQCVGLAFPACPGGTTIDALSGKATFDQAALVGPPTTGNSGTLPGAAITCLIQTTCTGCSPVFLGQDVCAQGGAVAGAQGTAGRTPTNPDPNSPACTAVPIIINPTPPNTPPGG